MESPCSEHVLYLAVFFGLFFSFSLRQLKHCSNKGKVDEPGSVLADLGYVLQALSSRLRDLGTPVKKLLQDLDDRSIYSWT